MLHHTFQSKRTFGEYHDLALRCLYSTIGLRFTISAHYTGLCLTQSNSQVLFVEFLYQFNSQILLPSREAIHIVKSLYQNIVDRIFWSSQIIPSICSIKAMIANNAFWNSKGQSNGQMATDGDRSNVRVLCIVDVQNMIKHDCLKDG